MVDPLRGTFGVFTSLSRLRSSGIEDAARRAEDAGYTALWIADVRGDISPLEHVASATTRLRVATAVLSIWDAAADHVAAGWRSVEQSMPGRSFLGVGVSHPALAARAGQVYSKPLASLGEYLDILDAGDVPPETRFLGANGPKMLDLAAERAAGAVTQMVTPERTAEQRARLGDGPLLATELKVVVGGSQADRRALGRANLRNYLGLPSYRKNLMSLGFDEDDLSGDGSDLLVDALVAGPDRDSITRRIAEQRDAGADHLCLHVLSANHAAPAAQWETLAELLDLKAPTREDS